MGQPAARGQLRLDATAQKNKAELGKLSLGVKFQKADALFAEKRYEEAAKVYVEIVDRDPHGEDADKALNNAAVGLRERQALRGGDQAVRAHRQRVSDVEVRRRRAVPHRGQLPEGVRVRQGGRRYQRLAEDKRFAASTHRTDALYNAAIILENDQNYAKAAELFKRYAPRRRSSARMRPRRSSARRQLEKLKDHGQGDQDLQRVHQELRQRSEGASASSRRCSASRDVRGQARQAPPPTRCTRRSWPWARARPPASEQAEYPAHAAFILTEQKLPIVEKAKISGGGKAAGGVHPQVQAERAGHGRRVQQGARLQPRTWTLAAYFRTGYLLRDVFQGAAWPRPVRPRSSSWVRKPATSTAIRSNRRSRALMKRR